jgi:hypothetical protein
MRDHRSNAAHRSRLPIGARGRKARLNGRTLLWAAVVAEMIAIFLLVRVSRQMADRIKQFHREAIEDMRLPQA